MSQVKTDIKPAYELTEKVTDYNGNKVIITIAVFDTPVSTKVVDIYSIAYIIYDTDKRPDYEDQVLYYGSPEYYQAKLTEEQAKAQMEYIKQNLENYKFKDF